MKKIYLDYAAYCPPLPECLSCFLETLEYTGNSQSMHSFGSLSNSILKSCINKIKDIYDCNYDDKVIFTSGATESNNIALNGFKSSIDQYIIGSTEHSSVYNTVKYKNVKVVMVKDGVIDLEELKGYLSHDKKTLVSIMMVNNETGVITSNIKEAIDLVHEYKGLFHSDCAQAAIKIPMSFKSLNIDMISMSSAKVGSVAGSGLLIAKSSIFINNNFEPIIKGGGQQGDIRSGTPPIALINAFTLALENGTKNIKTQNQKDKDIMNEIISHLIYHDCYIVGSNRVPSILYLSDFKTHQSEQVALLDQRNICVSAGSACNKGGGIYSDKFYQSHNLYETKKQDNNNTLNHSLDFIKNAYSTGIRVSIGPQTTKSDVSEFVEAWIDLL